MIERYKIVNKYDDTPVGADFISSLQSEQPNNIPSKIVGAESISALQSKQQDNMSSKQRADMPSKQRTDMESAPTTQKQNRTSVVSCISTLLYNKGLDEDEIYLSLLFQTLYAQNIVSHEDVL